MKWLNNTSFGLVLFGFMFLSFLIGVGLNDFPLLKFDPNIKLYEILTLFLALSIPFFVKKWIEDKRAIKSSIIDEVKEIGKTISDIQTVLGVTSNSEDTSFSLALSDTINRKFHVCELQIQSLKEQLDTSFKISGRNLADEIFREYVAYKNFLTGEEVTLNENLTVTTTFLVENYTRSSIFERKLKVAIHEIHKF